MRQLFVSGFQFPEKRATGGGELVLLLLWKLGTNNWKLSFPLLWKLRTNNWKLLS